jgi:hypothetical protein
MRDVLTGLPFFTMFGGQASRHVKETLEVSGNQILDPRNVNGELEAALDDCSLP